jgi:hypothetical protein
MKKYFVLLLCFVLTLSACSQDNSSSESVSGESEVEEVTSGPDCYGTDKHPVGQSIADQFEDTSYEQVMVWFCNGAEFEDILQALQTQELTGDDPETLLQRIAEGETWDEIWLDIGFTEE